jgi:RelB antitoxin.
MRSDNDYPDAGIIKGSVLAIYRALTPVRPAYRVGTRRGADAAAPAAQSGSRPSDAKQTRGRHCSTSDVIRLVMMCVAEEGRLPFEVKPPDFATRRTIDVLEKGHGKRFETADALFNNMGI